MIGDRLAELRRDRGQTQQDLANILSVTKFTVSNWEQGKSEPSHELLVKICQIYDVSSDYLLGLSNEDPAFARRRRERFTPAELTELKNMEQYLLWRRRHGEMPQKDQRKTSAE